MLSSASAPSLPVRRSPSSLAIAIEPGAAAPAAPATVALPFKPAFPRADSDLRVRTQTRSLTDVWTQHRRSILLLLVALGAVVFLGSLIGTQLNEPAPTRPTIEHTRDAVLPNALTFVSIGDWGRRGQFNQTELGYVLGEWVGGTGAAFIANVGDSFYDSGVTGVDDPQWQESFQDVYTHPALSNVPWYSILGNHDYRGDIEAQIGWEGDPRWHMPGRNHSARWDLPGGGCLHTVFVDTVPYIGYYRKSPESPQMVKNLNSADPVGQTAWAEDELAAGRSACEAVIVVGHHPLYSAALHGNNPDLINTFGPLLDQYAVDAYISGHDHTLMHLYDRGMDFFITGAGSRLRMENGVTPNLLWSGNVNGFTVHSINATHALHSFVTLGGSVAHAVLRPLRAMDVPSLRGR